MNNTNIQIIKHDYDVINTGDNVIFEDILLENGEIEYISSNGNIIINEDGKYSYYWSVATQALNDQTGVIFSLKVDDLLFPSNSPIKQNEVIGFGVINVFNTPVNLSLVNTSNNNIYLANNVPIKATLMINKLPDALSPIPYISLPIINNQIINQNDFITFNAPLITNQINYDQLLNLIAILEPGIYRICLSLFTDASSLTLSLISTSETINFDLPTGFGIKVIEILHQFDEPNYINFHNPNSTEAYIGLPGDNQNGSLVIYKISNI